MWGGLHNCGCILQEELIGYRVNCLDKTNVFFAFCFYPLLPSRARGLHFYMFCFCVFFGFFMVEYDRMTSWSAKDSLLFFEVLGINLQSATNLPGCCMWDADVVHSGMWDVHIVGYRMWDVDIVGCGLWTF